MKRMQPDEKAKHGFLVSYKKVSELDKQGMSPLHKASQAVILSNVISLLQDGADVCATDKFGRAAVHYAARAGFQDIIELLKQHDAYINVKDDLGTTALDIAVQNGHYTLVKYLIEEACANMSFKTMQGAIEHGHLNIVRYLVDKDLDINEQNSEKVSYLHIASQKGNLAVVKVLVESLSTVDMRDKNGWTPLQLAAQTGNLDIVKYLIQQGAKINLEPSIIREFPYNNPSTALHHAAGNGKLNVVNFLVNSSAQIDSVDADGITAFMIAASIGHKEIASFLIENGADINHKDTSGNTALHNSVNNYSMLEYLVDTAAYLNMKNKKGCTVLHCAVEIGSLDVVRYLVNKGIEINPKDSANDSPLQYAIRTGNLEIVKCLLQSGAEVSALIYRSMQHKFQNFAKKISTALLNRAKRLLDRIPTIPSNMLLADLYEFAPVTALQVRAEALMISKRFSEANNCSLSIFEHTSASQSEKSAAADAIAMYHISPVNNGIEDAALENARDRSFRYIKALEYALAGTEATLSLVLDYFQETKGGPNSAQFVQDLTVYYNNRTSLDSDALEGLNQIINEFGRDEASFCCGC